MKHILYIFFICFCFSCASSTDKIDKKQISNLQMGNIYIGMSLDDFKESVPNNTYVLTKGNLSIFRSDISAFLKSTDSMNVKSPRNRFRYFYFMDDELLNIDGGSDVSNYRMGIK